MLNCACPSWTAIPTYHHPRPMRKHVTCHWPSGFIVIFAVLAALLATIGGSPHQYSNTWAVQVNGGESMADDLASKHGFVNFGEIMSGYFLFGHNSVRKRSVRRERTVHRKLAKERSVMWMKQQVIKKRTKRDFLIQPAGPGPLPGSLPGLPHPDFPLQSHLLHPRHLGQRTVNIGHNYDLSTAVNDVAWQDQWYLNRGLGLDMNVQEAWSLGYTGKGVVVTILDDGIEYTHPDLSLNYDPLASYDVNDRDRDPMPRYDYTNENKHGTRCAGEVSAEANNNICVAGAAYNASIGGVRMLDGEVTDAVEAMSLSLNPQHIHIYSASWGPDDDGRTVDGPAELARKAFYDGIMKGRGGLGSIFVWASGNGGRAMDSCNCDGYTNSMYTLSISSATESGNVPWYSEACSSSLATTYSSGSLRERQIVTTDLHHTCTSRHTGTSASAPLAAAVVALALEANPLLTWRDMQHIVVRTAKPDHLRAADWATNGVGRRVSHSFGYGLMDAGDMVRLATKWKTVPDQHWCEVTHPNPMRVIPREGRVVLTLQTDGCLGTKNEVNHLEHVMAKVSISAPRRGEITVFLTSPSGTRSTLLAKRPRDSSSQGFRKWSFMTTHCWDEKPQGNWTLEVYNDFRYGDGQLTYWSILTLGTATPPQPSPATTTTTTTTTAAPAEEGVKWEAEEDEKEKEDALTSVTSTAVTTRERLLFVAGDSQSKVTTTTTTTTTSTTTTTTTTPTTTTTTSPHDLRPPAVAVDWKKLDSQGLPTTGKTTGASEQSQQWSMLMYGTSHHQEPQVQQTSDVTATSGVTSSLSACVTWRGNLCLECSAPQYLYDGQCYKTCPPGTTPRDPPGDSTGGQCAECPAGVCVSPVPLPSPVSHLSALDVVAITVCVGAVMLFFVVFGYLQARDGQETLPCCVCCVPEGARAANRQKRATNGVSTSGRPSSLMTSLMSSNGEAKFSALPQDGSDDDEDSIVFKQIIDT